ncbi:MULTISPECIES: kynureninase [Bradyrhizobium]|uniref:kynureninase n=1 Tax=Bradyrhizobium TaxID=374 RepID=UPI00155E0CEA|nr:MULTISPECIES: kynureninase [Bradyrhizobium]MDD1522661.1 kynureninase [Bradyrhizobium sp. WBAH30]MDD1547421.1 kynureninase [Bradyrhizobium sp. WBAH41]MDD1561059.1 kynureninase [Bradyrhizobium sp. WBAH23]MDD1568501.1 kynureninase [Bradyrhizobium sp. WBAH33]MDD1594430.1 kynureninase [Bradyrhizobium sp. WBAH42]
MTRLRVYDDTKALFHLPDGLIYLDGNSLGALPLGVAERVNRVITEEWGNELIRAWNTAGWYVQPRHVGDRIARLIGAEAGSVMVGDTLSLKVYQALAAALDMTPSRKIVLSDTGNFPTDLYMAEGLIATLGRGHQLRLVAPEEIEGALSDETAVLYITEVDYRTGRRHDMAKLTARAHALGIVTLWDLAHSAGALPVDLAGSGADFAAGCTYKYLNAGPGAPAFLYVAPRHADSARAALSGWMGHAKPFAFELAYAAAGGVERMRVGTPPVLAMAALEASLDIWDKVDIAEVRARSLALGDLLISEVERHCPQLKLVTPRDHERRGSQVSFAFDGGYAAMQALIARGVIGDFRAPDIMRFGLTPLYVGENEIIRAAEIIEEVISGEVWRRPEYQVVNAVT